MMILIILISEQSSNILQNIFLDCNYDLNVLQFYYPKMFTNSKYIALIDTLDLFNIFNSNPKIRI